MKTLIFLALLTLLILMKILDKKMTKTAKELKQDLDRYEALFFYVCKCGRKQRKYKEFEEDGEIKCSGIIESAAERMGWRKINNEWKCPFCSGNTNNLRKVFGKGFLNPDEFESYGR